MPLTRYQARNEYGLADPDLYQAADKDDPEALLEGVAMAGLVGILRQLGDLAEFAAEMFHDLHEEVMATAARSHGLMARVQQLEAEFPSIEKALLCQTDHSPFFSNKGVEWHPNLQLEQSVITRGDLPRCVMDSYEECRGPPRLFLLDKFDISGAGACLKRYTDPAFVRHETSSYEASWDDIQREKKSQKAKKRASHWRNGGTLENALTSHAKLHELFLEEHLEAHQSDQARVVKLKTRKLDGYSLISKSGESYMEKFVQTCVNNETAYELNTPNPGLLTWNMDSARDVVTEIPEISMVGALEKSHGGSRAKVSLPNEEDIKLNEKDVETVPESTHKEVPCTTTAKDLQINLNGKPGCLQHSYSEDLTSEADNYVDAPATMESETETDDECRPKNRSDALKDLNHHSYSDVDEQRMEDPARFSFFHSMENTPLSENGQSSFGKRSTSVSYSDTASLSIDDQSDGEKSSGCLPSTFSSKNELVDSTSNVTPEANKVAHDFNTQESVSRSNVDGQRSISSNDTCSSPRPVLHYGESCSLTVQSLTPEVVETSPKFVSLDLIKGQIDESKVDPIDSSISGASFDVKNSNCPSETSSICSTSEGSRCDTTSEKNYFVDYSSNVVNSGKSQTGKQLAVTDYDIETNSTVAGSENLASSGSDPKSCDGSLTGKLLHCSDGIGMEVSPDMSSKFCGPNTVDVIHVKDTLGDETDFVTVTNAVAYVDPQSSVAEISSEHSADVSISESHTLENGMSIPAKVDSKLTSDVNSGGEKLVGDASPTCSKSDEHTSDIPAELHSSYMHDEGFHDFARLDNAATDIVSKVELFVSDNLADTSSGNVNQTNPSSTSLICSLTRISTNTYQSSSEAGEICNDTVVESNRALRAGKNLESEKNMQKSPLEVSSEGLGTVLDNNELASCESLSPMISLGQNDRDTETRSPCTSSLVDNCTDSSPANNLNLLESTTIEHSVKVPTPSASHAFADVELLQSNVCRGLVSAPQSPGLKFVPQSAGIELSSPKQALNLDPTFPGFGSIPETTLPNQELMPPLPPLPPMQWRIGKAPHSYFPTFMGESVETSSVPLADTPPASLGSDKSEQLPGEFGNNASEELLQSSVQFPTTGVDLNVQYDTIGSQRTQSTYLSAKFPTTMPNQGHIEDFGSEENNLLAGQAAKSHEIVYSQDLSLQMPEDPSVKYEDFKEGRYVHVSQSSQGHHCPETKGLASTQPAVVEDKGHYIPDASNAETGEPSKSSVQKVIPVSVGDAMWPVNAFAVAPTLETNMQEEVPLVRLPRPRSPLVDAVAAHDRRMMKKVSERVQPPIKSKQDEKDSLLAQIRNKSVNLKPAVATRPSIQTGPKTNLRVAAILEKANTIRQAMAGSDEDEDSDGWSDS